MSNSKNDYPEEFTWSDDMADTTPLASVNVDVGKSRLEGKDYEAQNRKLIKQTVQWLRANVKAPGHGFDPEEDLNGLQAISKLAKQAQQEKNPTSFMDGIIKHLLQQDHLEGKPSMNQICLAIGHAMFIWYYGWPEYVDRLRKKKQQDQEVTDE